MNKTFFIVIGLLAIVLVVLVLNRQPASDQEITANRTTAKTQITKTQLEKQARAFGAIDVEVVPIQIQNGKPITLEVALDTHSVELAYDFEQITSVSDDQGNSYQVVNWDGGSGGHHLSGTLELEPLQSKAKVLTVEFDGIDNQTGRFTWKLPEADADKLSYTNLSSTELTQMLETKDFTLVDVHIPEQQHIPGTDAFIPFNQVNNLVEALPDKDERIVLYCRSGSMSQQAANELLERGYTNIYNLQFGMNEWQSEGFETLPIGSL